MQTGCKKDVLHLQKVQKLNSNTASRLNRLKFVNDSVCIAAGGEIWSRSEVLRSADGGYTWTANAAPQVGKGMYGAGVSPAGGLYLSGIDGNVLWTVDGGASWKTNRIETWRPYIGGTFVTADTGIFASTVLQRECTISRVDSTFKVLDEQTFNFGLNDVVMANSSRGYVIGYGAVMITNDRGRTWNFQDVEGDNFTAMDIHESEIWMCGANGGVYHTTDGGDNWSNLRDGNNMTLPAYMLRDIVFKDKLHGWCVGDKGVVIHTDDGGNHWMEYERFTASTLRSIVLCPNGDLLTAGDDGALYRMIP